MRTKLIYHPYSTFEASDETSLKLCERLHDLLPHGSGINYAWDITRNKRSHVFYASNCYQAMNENGYYCHAYDFTVSYKYNGSEAYKPCEYCGGRGVRYVRDLLQYHPLHTEESLADWLENEHRVTTKIFRNEFGLAFSCNACHGSGKIKLPEFEFVRLNFHGQKEYACCGYDLKNYLAETLTLK